MYVICAYILYIYISTYQCKVVKVVYIFNGEVELQHLTHVFPAFSETATMVMKLGRCTDLWE